MQAGKSQRESEDGQQLGTDAGADLLLCHTDLLHDFEAFGVFITLGDLLVVDDQHSSEDENNTQQNTNEEEAAISAIEFGGACSTGIEIQPFD